MEPLIIQKITQLLLASKLAVQMVQIPLTSWVQQ